MNNQNYEENYKKLLDFVKKIASNYNFHDTEGEFIKFYIEIEDEASIILEEIGES